MDDFQRRLAGCFQTVFPSLNDTSVLTASQENTATWDSIATVTLLNLIEEEFHIEADLDRLTELNSFPILLGYVRHEARAQSS